MDRIRFAVVGMLLAGLLMHELFRLMTRTANDTRMCQHTPPEALSSERHTRPETLLALSTSFSICVYAIHM